MGSTFLSSISNQKSGSHFAVLILSGCSRQKATIAAALMRRADGDDFLLAFPLATSPSHPFSKGIIGINPLAVKLTPPYFAYLLYRNHIGNSVLATSTEGSMTSFDPQLPALDAIATVSDNGQRLYVAVINRNEADDVSTTIQIKEWTPRPGTPARVFVLNGKDKVAATEVNIRAMTASVVERSIFYRVLATWLMAEITSSCCFGG